MANEIKHKDWFKSKPMKLFKDKPKKKTKLDEDFSPKKALKTAGSLAVLGVGIHLATELID